MMENHATKMRTTKDKRQTRMFHRELCFAAGGSIGKRKSETERGDIATGPNATVTPVAGIKGGDWTYTTFGSIFVVDDPVTLSISPTSEMVGRAQGLLVASAHDGANVNVALSIMFTNLLYKALAVSVRIIERSLLCLGLASSALQGAMLCCKLRFMIPILHALSFA
ncbi:hypothetical protein glysoja_006696 [Glycine soja]|nr:hypothetical protein glysoja_006696 [Glycine soja]